jgi:Holliday junction resolvasome RuvABC endonuclease subunit
LINRSVLAIDPGVHAGWAFKPANSEEEVIIGTQHFPILRDESRGMRFIRFQAWLGTFIMGNRPDLVLYEKPHMRGGATTEILVGESTLIETVCAVNKIEYGSVRSQEVKMTILGKGFASKEEMMNAANMMFGPIDIEDEHQADALCLLGYAIRKNMLVNVEFV